ncbi:MAG: hypothetical protein IKZ90_08960 [Clostridiales bacterium]|nr:hypothetical protein [Clostridiales bacterium]
MTRTIAIIDADFCFTSLLISRLRKYLPDFLAFPVSRDVILSHPSLLLDNDFVLYNQHEISQKEVLQHCAPECTPALIPLLSETKPNPPKDVLMLVHEVESRAVLGRIPLSRESSVQTCLTLSFVPQSEREAHVLRQIERARSDFAHIIRLDIMPGILMPQDPPSWVIPGGKQSCGISKLLQQMKRGNLSPSSISSFLEPDPYGDLRFGKPEHSDDVITCHSRTILTLISRTYQYLRSLKEPSLLIVVCDGISFVRMRTLCRRLSHLEILTPIHLEKDYMLCDEIDMLQKEHCGTSHIDFPFSLSEPSLCRR